MRTLFRRLWNFEPTMRATVSLVVLAMTLSLTASVVATIAFARTGQQVTKINGLQTAQTKFLAAVSLQAHTSCVRAMRLAPALADDYARRRVFQREYGNVEGAKRLGEARSTIPKTCAATGIDRRRRRFELTVPASTRR